MASKNTPTNNSITTFELTSWYVSKFGRTPKGKCYANVRVEGVADGAVFAGNIQVYGDRFTDSTTPSAVTVKSANTPDASIMAALAANPDALAIYMRQFA